MVKRYFIFELYQMEDTVGLLRLFVMENGNETEKGRDGKNARKGAKVGAAVGAVTGVLTGNGLEGAIKGAVIGGTGGAILGKMK